MIPLPPQCDPPRSGFNLTGELSVKLKSTGFHTDAFLPDYKSGPYSNILRGNDVSPVFDVSDTGIQVNILDTLENIRLNMRINPPEAVD